MFKNLFLLTLFTVALGACSKVDKSLTNEGLPRSPFKKNPPSVPTTSNPSNPKNPTPIDTAVVRTVFSGFKMSADFLSELNSKGYYEYGNCVQWVSMKKGSQFIGNYLELSLGQCNYSGPADDSNVLMRLKVVEDGNPANKYLVINEENSSEIGIITVESSAGAYSYELQGLCDIDPKGMTKTEAAYCQVDISAGQFATPPLSMKL